jgi:predicted acetyltransferase
MKLLHRSTCGPLPTSSFDLVDDAGQVIGFAQLRHRSSCSNDLPSAAGNNVYYEIAEAYRGRGYGKALLLLILDEARHIGLDRVRLTVDDNKPAPRHIVEGAGGVLVGEFMSRATGEPCGCSRSAWNAEYASLWARVRNVNRLT